MHRVVEVTHEPDTAATMWVYYGRLEENETTRNIRDYLRREIDNNEQAATWVYYGNMYVPKPEPLPEPITYVQAAYSTAGYEVIRVLVSQYRDWDVNLMMRIGDCESGLQNIRSHYANYDGEYDWGWPQIHGEPEALDPSYATERAHEKFVSSGYSPWVSSRGCWG